MWNDLARLTGTKSESVSDVRVRKKIAGTSEKPRLSVFQKRYSYICTDYR